VISFEEPRPQGTHTFLDVFVRDEHKDTLLDVLDIVRKIKI
jgi:hypothetical protein